jgi:hypothetical protein
VTCLAARIYTLEKKAKKILVMCLACMCLSSIALTPPMPRQSTVLRSPKDAASQPVSLIIATTVTVAPVRQITLAWNYPPERLSSVQFELWFAADLYAASRSALATYDAVPLGFQLSVTAEQPPVTIQSNLPQQFFIVRAKSRATGTYSPWNQASSQGPVKLISPADGSVVDGAITLAAVIDYPLNAPWPPGGLTITQN